MPFLFFAVEQEPFKPRKARELWAKVQGATMLGALKKHQGGGGSGGGGGLAASAAASFLGGGGVGKHSSAFSKGGATMATAATRSLQSESLETA